MVLSWIVNFVKEDSLSILTLVFSLHTATCDSWRKNHKINLILEYLSLYAYLNYLYKYVTCK